MAVTSPDDLGKGGIDRGILGLGGTVAGNDPTLPPRAGPSRWRALSDVPVAYWVVGALLLLNPLLTSDFILYQVFGWAFILGMIALSLQFLGGYGGMVSLAQMTVAGVAGYMVAILGSSAVTDVSLGWPWWIATPLAILIAVAFGTLTGALAVRTEGIYTIMITLAISTAFFYFARQNYVIFNGFSGINQILPPPLFGVAWNTAVPFYYLSLGAAFLSYLAVLYVSRAPFGLALQGVRDNARRMAALGYDPIAVRIAAYAFAALIAAVAGVLLVWQTGAISPGTVAVGPAIDILIVAVIGGLRHPIGPFLGALVYVLLRTFALDALVAVGLDGERFRLLVGIGFLVIVFWSDDGLLGLWARWKARRGRDSLREPSAGEGDMRGEAG